MTAPARDLHQELAQEVEDATRVLREAELMAAELPSEGAEVQVHIRRRRLEIAVTRQRISEGRG